MLEPNRVDQLILDMLAICKGLGIESRQVIAIFNDPKFTENLVEVLVLAVLEYYESASSIQS